ncbi:trypsin-like serine protease [Telmatospirillum sp.]|uniref:trypsin-like serine protease n=1 Tax=Telmatospirillum sp. TaxID=2079197 RepID=UPI00284D33DC|nr:trypsin-like serine protease [Telmatospirillum sp.]MDR3439998.1 trypsin-like serine protease [Telmatospirillum sp.]
MALEFQIASTKIASSRIELVDGVAVPVQSKDWMTIVVTPILFNGQIQPVEGRCTGTLVGPGVILLAAHCLDQGAANGSLRPAFLKVDGERVPLICAIFPTYLGSPYSPTAPRRSEDFGMCHASLAGPHPIIAAMKYEMLDLTPAAAGQPVLMTGYGCTDIDKPEAMDATLRIGDAAIGYAAGNLGPAGDYATISSLSDDEPSLCPGDSGGPLFSGATVKSPQGQRRVRGVNSSYANVLPARFSKVAMLSLSGFSEWVIQWLRNFPDAYVCGISDPAVAPSCHG